MMSKYANKAVNKSFYTTVKVESGFVDFSSKMENIIYDFKSLGGTVNSNIISLGLTVENGYTLLCSPEEKLIRNDLPKALYDYVKHCIKISKLHCK